MSQICSRPWEGRLTADPRLLMGYNSPAVVRCPPVVTGYNCGVVEAQNSSLDLVVVSPHRIKAVK